MEKEPKDKLQNLFDPDCVDAIFAATPTQKSKPTSLIIKKTHDMIPAHLVAEAMSQLHGIRWSGSVTHTEIQYVKEYVITKYPEYRKGLILTDDCIEDNSKFPSGTIRVSSPCFGGSLPVLQKIRLEPSRLTELLTTKSSFPGTFVSVPEMQARSKVLERFGLTEDDYLVLFTSNYREAMMLVGESYPFFKGNYYITTIPVTVDCIREIATHKDSRVLLGPDKWLDLRIRGSQLSQYFRRKCRHSPKGLFSYPVSVNGKRYSLHWVSEASRNSWHVLLDATGLIVGGRSA